MSEIIPAIRRTRRNRRTPWIRDLTRETWLLPQNLILPVFIADPDDGAPPVPAGNSPWQVLPLHSDALLRTCERSMEAGVHSMLLLSCVSTSKKNPAATEATNPEGHYSKAIRSVKKRFPELTVISDVALGPYTLDGHDGIWHDGGIDDAKTLRTLAEMAKIHAEAGADYLGLSDMMDGRVAAIRDALDRHGLTKAGIMSYVKFASSLYAPFRKLIHSQLKGDKRTYQIDPSNGRDALREARQDVEEGADCLIVKPAVPYLDVVYRISTSVDVPVVAYHVSGESAMIEAAAHFGYVDREKALLETCSSIRRAGANAIITYSALDVARLLRA